MQRLSQASLITLIIGVVVLAGLAVAAGLGLFADAPLKDRAMGPMLHYIPADTPLVVVGRGAPGAARQMELWLDRIDIRDLDPLLDQANEVEHDSVADDGDHALTFLRQVDLDAELTLDRLMLAGLELSQVQASAHSRGGVLVIEPLAGVLEGGRVDARAEIDLRPAQPIIRIQPIFELESLARALQPWGLGERLDGRGRLVHAAVGTVVPARRRPVHRRGIVGAPRTAADRHDLSLGRFELRSGRADGPSTPSAGGGVPVAVSTRVGRPSDRARVVVDLERLRRPEVEGRLGDLQVRVPAAAQVVGHVVGWQGLEHQHVAVEVDPWGVDGLGQAHAVQRPAQQDVRLDVGDPLAAGRPEAEHRA
jgi:hypothetical protein